ncbi:MAG TPA: ATP-binding protein [Candidatus Limnocylindrales bacterium]|nr:ATP-binding protein [Candidatus Limnocylindrales bacterium]
MAHSSALDPGFGAASADRFRALLRRIVPLAVVFGALELLLAALYGDASTAGVGVMTTGYGLWLLAIASRLGTWSIGHIVLAAWMPILPLAVVAAALQPLAVPALTIVPLVAAAATLPFEPDPGRIRRLMFVTGLSAFGVIVVGTAEPFPTLLPAALHYPFVVSTSAAAVGLFLYLLSQFSWRLREALGDAVRATVELDEAHRERRRIDRELHEAQRVASLATLAGGVAHDFNNLLTAVVGNAELALSDTPADSPIRGELEAIRDAANRAAELSRLMHVYSAGARFTTGRVALPALVDDLRPDLDAALPAGVELVAELDRATPDVLGDPRELRRIVEHLVANAGEAIAETGAESGDPTTDGGAPRGTITIRVERREVTAADLATAVGDDRAGPGSYAVLTVDDTGPGVDPSLRERIWDPFVTTRFVGRGLGLAAVFGIVRGHHGAVRVDDRPGGGARFEVFLPPA